MGRLFVLLCCFITCNKVYPGMSYVLQCSRFNIIFFQTMLFAKCLKLIVTHIIDLLIQARANDVEDGVEEGYDSSRDEASSVSSYNPTKENLHKTFGSSLSLQSSAARSSNKDAPYIEGGRTSLSSALALPRLSVAEVLYDSSAGESVKAILVVIFAVLS